ncbi:MAG: hypothetical protein PHP04_14535 [Bacteroidales bacterium]|nr:hypothetical protein [Bacteroidales bacterium]
MKPACKLLFLAFFLMPFIHSAQVPEVDMVFVKGGTFRMGCTQWARDEQPVHEVL